MWLSASILAAQTEPLEKQLPARALALLRSERMSERAWGAYLCGSLLVGNCSAPLVAVPFTPPVAPYYGGYYPGYGGYYAPGVSFVYTIGRGGYHGRGYHRGAQGFRR